MLVSGFVVYVIKRKKLHSKTDKPLMSVFNLREKILTSYCIGVRILIRVSVTASVK